MATGQDKEKMNAKTPRRQGRTKTMGRLLSPPSVLGVLASWRSLLVVGILGALLPAWSRAAPAANPQTMWLHAGPLPAEAGSVAAQPLRLVGPDARRQLLVTTSAPDGFLLD